MDFVVVVCPALFNHPCLLIQVVRVQKAQFLYRRLACPISSQVTYHWGEPCNRTGEVHPVDLFHILNNLKNQFASIAFCRNSAVYNYATQSTVNETFRVITGCMKPTNVEDLYLLARIRTPYIRREVCEIM